MAEFSWLRNGGQAGNPAEVALGQLAGGMAHDFNNVLQIIGGNLQLLQLDPVLEEKGRQRVKIAIDAVERGARLSSQLLAFARRQPLQPRSINLARVLHNMDGSLRHAVGGAVEISTTVERDLWNAMLDPAQFEQLILNIAFNARDAMPNGGRLTLQAGNAALSDPYFLSQAELVPGDYVELSISDNGCGMSPEVRERAFEPFFSSGKEGEGSGLGLSMAYGFVKQSRGHIILQSEVGQGTTIRIYFPRSREEEIADAGLHEMEQEDVRGGNETILVVEDDPDLQLTVADTLSWLGYRVLKAGNGERALAIVRSGVAIDMLLTDVVMPGSLPATELARQVRRLLPEMEILFTSGYVRDAIVHEGRLDAGIELLSKPYRISQLARRIRHMLTRRAHHAQPMREPAAAGGDMRPRLRLLVVEDNLDSQELVCELLGALGHVAHGVATGEAAQQMLGEQAFDVLFTDVRLPGISGVDLARNTLSRFPGMSVIFASGYGASVTRNVGFAAYSLPKPYDITQLQDILQKIATAV